MPRRSGNRKAICSEINAPTLYARALLEQALEHAALAEADDRLMLEAIAAGRIATAGPSADQPPSTSAEFSPTRYSGS